MSMYDRWSHGDLDRYSVRELFDIARQRLRNAELTSGPSFQQQDVIYVRDQVLPALLAKLQLEELQT